MIVFLSMWPICWSTTVFPALLGFPCQRSQRQDKRWGLTCAWSKRPLLQSVAIAIYYALKLIYCKHSVYYRVCITVCLCVVLQCETKIAQVYLWFSRCIYCPIRIKTGNAKISIMMLIKTSSLIFKYWEQRMSSYCIMKDNQWSAPTPDHMQNTKCCINKTRK